MKTIGEKLRQCDSVGLLTVTAQPFGCDQPVNVSSHCQSDGCPGGVGNSTPVRHSRQSHEKPSGHIRSFCTHGSYPWSQCPAAEEIIFRTLVCSLGKGQTDSNDDQHIENHGDHNLHGIIHTLSHPPIYKNIFQYSRSHCDFQDSAWFLCVFTASYQSFR